jgi:hypothetical protein
MSKRARERGDKRDWPKLWGKEVQDINWPDLGNGRICTFTICGTRRRRR